MSAKAVILVWLVLVSLAASISGAQGEADGCVVNPASGGTEQVQSCSDSTSLLQGGLRTRSAGEGETSQSSSRKHTAEESHAKEEVAGEEEAEDEDEEDEVEQDEEDEENEEDDDFLQEGNDEVEEKRENCVWKRSGSGSKCEKTCRKTASCYGFKASSGVGRSRRRCTFYESGGGDGEACLARCKMPAGKACDGYAEVFSGASCAPGCAVGLTVSVDTPAPKSLSCKDGALTPTPDYTCVDAAAKGKLTVTVVKASNLEDEDWMSGDSDPYVIVDLNGKKEQTGVVKNSNNPTWNHEITYEVSSQNDKLSFHVWDEDSAAMDDDLGATTADLAEVIQKGGEKTYDLSLAPSQGTLTVKLKFQA